MLSRWKEMLVTIKLSTDLGQFTKGYDLAQELRVTDRTIRNDIIGLNKMLEKNGGKIIAVRGQGYQLEISNLEAYQQFFEANFTEIFKSGQDDRLEYILTEILLNNNKITDELLYRKFYVSNSSMNNDFAKLQAEMAAFNLLLRKDKEKGYLINGREDDIRKFMLGYFLKENLISINQSFDFFTKIEPDLPLVDIVITLNNVAKDYHYELSDQSLFNLFNTIVISIIRMKHGLFIDETSEQKIQPMIITLVENLEECAKIIFPSQERIHLQNLFQAHNRFLSISKAEQLRLETIEILKNIELETSSISNKESNIVEELVAHIQAMLVRVKNKITYKNPLLDEIKSRYPDDFELIKRHFSKSETLSNYEISDDEYSYLVLYYLSAKESMIVNFKINVLIVCGTGKASGQFLISKLNSVFKGKLNIQGVVSYIELNQYDFVDVDLVISAINIQNIILPVPVIQTEIFLSNKDISVINNYINKKIQQIRQSKPRIKDTTIIPSLSLFDQISHCFDKSRFYYFEKETNNRNIMEKLIRASVGNDETKCKQLEMQLKYREQLGSTAFSSNIVVPHPLNPIADKTSVSIGVIKEGLVWDDKHPLIHLVILLSPKMYDTQLTKVTELLAKLVNLNLSNHEIVNIKTFETFIEIINKL